jgi:hypothetical protein
MTRDQLVLAKEESTEFGGYFICNGIERIIRMLILQVCVLWLGVSASNPAWTPAWVGSSEGAELLASTAAACVSLPSSAAVATRLHRVPCVVVNTGR